MLVENLVKAKRAEEDICPAYKMRVWRFFWIIMSCTESMVAFSSVVSVALV